MLFCPSTRSRRAKAASEFVQTLALSLLLCLPALSQSSYQTTQTIALSGASFTVSNTTYNSETASFLETVFGNPTSTTVTVSGCTAANSCTSLDSSVTSGNSTATRQPSIGSVYDHFQVAASWTGGSGVFVVVRVTITGPAPTYPSSGGAVSSVSGTPSQVTCSPTTGSVVCGIAPNAALPGAPTTTKPASTSNSTQVATTNYVRQLFAALNPATAVAAATVAVLPDSPTYSNGTSGAGATLTATTAAALVVDGYTLSLTNRLLVNNQANPIQNGVYSLTTLGTGSVDYVLTRTSDFNSVGDINNAGVIPVTNGTVNAGTTWALDANISAIGTSAISYDQTNSQPPAVVTINSVPCTVGSSCTITASGNPNGYGMWELTVPQFANFSWANQGSATYSSGTNFLSIVAPSGSSSNSLAVLHQPCPAVPFDLYGLAIMSYGVANTSAEGGIEIDDGTKLFGAEMLGNGSSSDMATVYFTGATGSRSTVNNDSMDVPPAGPFWWHLHVSASNAITAYYGTEALGMRQLTDASSGTLSAITNCGFYINNTTSSSSAGSASITVLAFQFGALVPQ